MIVQATGTAGVWLDEEATVLVHAAIREHIRATLAVGASPPPQLRTLHNALAPAVEAIDRRHATRAASTSAPFSASTVAPRMKSVDAEAGMSTAAVAARFTVSKSLVSSWVREGQLEAVGGGGRGRSWQIDPASVEALAQRRAHGHQHP